MIGVACIGGAGHGKSRLLTAICHTLPTTTAPVEQKAQLNPLPVVPSARPSLDRALFERIQLPTSSPQQPYLYDIRGRTFAHFDCPGHLHFSRATAHCLAFSDIALLVVSSAGIDLDTRQHLAMAEAMGLSKLIIFVNTFADAMLEHEPSRRMWFSLMEGELRAILPDCYRGAPVLFGSAQEACIDALEERNSPMGREAINALLEALSGVDIEPLDASAPMRFWSQRRFTIHGHWVVLGGRVAQGTLKPGDPIEYQAPGAHPDKACLTTIIESIEINHQKVAKAVAGDIVGLCLDRVTSGSAARRQLCVTPGSRKSTDMALYVRGRLCVFPSATRDIHWSPRNGAAPQFQSGTLMADGKIQLREALVVPCSTEDRAAFDVEVTFSQPIPLSPRLLVREQRRVVGYLEEIVLLEPPARQWLWYNAEIQETLGYMRQLLYGDPNPVLWEQLWRCYQGVSVLPITPELQEHLNACSTYILDHMEGWREQLCNDGDPWAGLWRCDSDGEEGDGLGRFVEIQRYGKPSYPKRYRVRDVLVRYPADLTSLLYSLMFVKVWKEPRPFATSWCYPAHRRVDGERHLHWETRDWPTDIDRSVIHRAALHEGHQMTRESFGPPMSPSGERKLIATMSFRRVAQFAPGA